MIDLFAQDYHGTGNTKPELDTQSNWELLSFSEKEGITFLQIKRLLDTCDNTEDIKITVRLFFHILKQIID
jgi:hypothetical protein